jgi:superfamily II RNA helicase
VAKNIKKEEEIEKIEEVKEKVGEKEEKTEEIKEKVEEQRLVYIGNDIKTRELSLNKFTPLLSKPANYDELLEKYPELAKLLIPIEDFPRISKEMTGQKQMYYKALAARVNKAMLEGGK